MSAPALPSRHDLVRLAPSWRGSLLAPPDPEAFPLLEAWLDRGLPAVACRFEGAPPPGAVALGVAFPPATGRRRASLLVPLDAVASVARPLRLAAAAESAPAGWHDALLDLDERARALGVSLAVYGSLAWQHLSGDRYLSAASDVDLLVEPRSPEELAAALGLLASRASLRAPRLDGEILLPGGLGVPWREVLAGPRRVLAKSLSAAALVPLREALGRLAAVEATP